LVPKLVECLSVSHAGHGVYADRRPTGDTLPPLVECYAFALELNVAAIEDASGGVLPATDAEQVAYRETTQVNQILGGLQAFAGPGRSNELFADNRRRRLRWFDDGCRWLSGHGCRRGWIVPENIRIADGEISATQGLADVCEAELRDTLANQGSERVVLQRLLQRNLHLGVNMPCLPKLIDGAHSHIIPAEQAEDTHRVVKGFRFIDANSGEQLAVGFNLGVDLVDASLSAVGQHAPVDARSVSVVDGLDYPFPIIEAVPERLRLDKEHR
jgi:hypothetical protein